MKIRTIVLVVISFCASLSFAQTSFDETKKFSIVKSKTADDYARIFSGTVHIGPHGATSDTPNLLNHASQEAIADATLHVEVGIITERMTYLLAEDWDQWPDYVFEDNYNLMPLEQLEKFIEDNKHLPDVISQDEVRRLGVDDNQMNIILLKKVEELTLYTIKQDKTLKEQEDIIETLINRLNNLEAQIETQK